MKLLNLIFGKNVTAAPGVKVIPKAEFSKLIDAKELLEEIKQEGVEHRAQIAKEGEELFEKSKEEGFEKGLEKWSEQIKFLEEEKANVRHEIEKVIAKVALLTTQKILDREVKQKPSTIIDIIAKHLKSVANHRKITIFVHKGDLKIFDENRETLKQVFKDLETFVIQERDDISQGGAIIETEAGIIDARIDSLWKSIETAFEGLLRKK